MKKFNKNDFIEILYKYSMDDTTFDKWMDNPKNFNNRDENNTRDRGHGEHWNKIRELFNKIHAESKLLHLEDIRNIDNEFLSQKITYDSYFNRLSKAPMNDKIFKEIEGSDNKNHQFDPSNTNNGLYFLDNIRRLTNKLYENKRNTTNQDIFAWVKWFGELVEIVDDKNEDTLSVLINQAIQDENQSIIRFEAYDPFSFFYYLAQKNTTNQRKLFFQAVDTGFGVNTILPDFDNDNCWIFPTPTPQANVLYKWDSSYEPKLLWDFFQQVTSIKRIEELALKVIEDEFIDDFQAVLKLTSVGVPKLTQTLFLINPSVFFTIDWILKPISDKLLDNPDADAEKNIQQLKKNIERDGFHAYLKIMQKIHMLFPNKTPYEINYQLWSGGDNMTDEKLQEKIDLLKHKKQIILQGSPGTGKTRKAKEIAYNLITGEVLCDDDKERKKQFKKITETNQKRIPKDTTSEEIYACGLQFIHVGQKFRTIAQETEFKVGDIYGEKIYIQNQGSDKKISVGKNRILSYIKDKNYNETYGHYSYQQPIAKFMNEVSFSYNRIILLKGKELKTEAKQKFEITKVENKKVYYKYLANDEWSDEYYLKIKDGKVVWNEQDKSNPYFLAIKKEVEDAVKDKNLIDYSNQYKLIQFHPEYSYEDFVRGIVAKTTDKGVMYETQNKVLAEIAENAFNNHDEKFVLIIDEINRANLPAVLGELIYALEYRGEAVESMYAIDGDRKIILPENLYIIGTMNTADRSVGHIDYAIRRRFAFIDVKTDEGVIPENAKLLFSKIESLFNEHLSDEFAKDDVMIGHSYFLNDDLKMAFEYEIKPILYEYVKDGVLTCEKDKITELNTV